MSSIDSRVHKLETRINTTYGLVAGAVVMLLAFLGFTSWKQIPREIQAQLPDVVSTHIQSKNTEILASIDAAKESIEKDSVEINKGVIETLSNVDESSSVLDNLKTEKIPFRLDSGVIK